MSATAEFPVTRSQSQPVLLMLLPSAAVWCLIPGLSPFAVMCGIALTLFVLIKLHTLLHYISSRGRIDSRRDIAAWFLVWPGLDAAAFFDHRHIVRPSVRRQDWLAAVTRICVGILLWTAAAPRLLPVSEVMAGWTALTGIALILHFGTFHLLALWWQQSGRAVVPIMNAPARATSLTDFWSRRWNLAFRDYAHFALFTPLARRMSPAAAVMIGYLFSGLLHELAISVPAAAGYGLPTLYFVIQGAAILCERRLRRHRLFSKSAMAGWLWTMAVTAGPACLLFHSPFLHRVVIPLVAPFAS